MKKLYAVSALYIETFNALDDAVSSRTGDLSVCVRACACVCVCVRAFACVWCVFVRVCLCLCFCTYLLVFVCFDSFLALIAEPKIYQFEYRNSQQSQHHCQLWSTQICFVFVPLWWWQTRDPVYRSWGWGNAWPGHESEFCSLCRFAVQSVYAVSGLMTFSCVVRALGNFKMWLMSPVSKGGIQLSVSVQKGIHLFSRVGCEIPDIWDDLRGAQHKFLHAQCQYCASWFFRQVHAGWTLPFGCSPLQGFHFASKKTFQGCHGFGHTGEPLLQEWFVAVDVGIERTLSVYEILTAVAPQSC